MTDNLELRVANLEAKYQLLANLLNEGVDKLKEVIATSDAGIVQAIWHVLEDMIATDIIDRNRLILILEKHAEMAEEKNGPDLQQTASLQLLMCLRRGGEPNAGSGPPRN